MMDTNTAKEIEIETTCLMVVMLGIGNHDK